MRKVKPSIATVAYSPRALKLVTFFTINLLLGGYFCVALMAPASTLKKAWLPGTTTHGHHQIELDCDACHDPGSSPGTTETSNQMQEACIRCHGAQLAGIDTHPAKKFNDPTNADLLATLDAQDCLSCHAEHVPHQTLTMGLTIPSDYCWHCHDDIGEIRPSHQDFAFDSCSTAGCHNYHDNTALYEKFLDDHYGDPDYLDVARVATRDTSLNLSAADWTVLPLERSAADHPESVIPENRLIHQWSDSTHASAGVNCSHCHEANDKSESWSNDVSMDTCGHCHAKQLTSFRFGKHGMRIASKLSPMTPSQARLPMHSEADHRQLDCNACHAGHRFDTAYAAVDACLRCHADDHSLAYADSSHATLWRDEVLEKNAAGSGVSCATCHLPRLDDEQGVWVNHDQNANLRPNEKMARDVCLNCHGLEYSLSALADVDLIRRCFTGSPDERIESLDMARQWFQQRDTKPTREIP